MDGGIGILIVFVVIGIISAAVSSAKKKGGGDSGQNGQDGQPPRRTMSDIQRAFMMMSGLENEEERQPGRPAAPRQQGFAPPPPQQGGYAPPAPQPRFVPPAAPPRPGYVPPVAYGEGITDYGTVRSGSLMGETTLEKEAGRAGSLRTALSGSLRGNTPIETEAVIEKYTSAAQTIKETGESIDENELSILGESGGIYGENLSAVKTNAKHTVRPALKLFSNKNDFVRAVIYSEIMGSGPLAKRSAK